MQAQPDKMLDATPLLDNEPGVRLWVPLTPASMLGNAAAHHEKAASLLSLANWIAQQTGATVGYLTEAANTVGAQFAGAHPFLMPFIDA